jgi:hypothetical protein
MTRQNLLLIAAALALSGCASMDVSASAPSASLQNAVFIPNADGAGLRPASANNLATMPGESKAMRFYWFLAGR